MPEYAPTWNDLSKPGARAAPQPSAEQKRFDELCATVFSVGPGAELLAAMRARTIEKRSPQRAHEVQLREDEAVRYFVHSLEMARDRGNEPKPNPA